MRVTRDRIPDEVLKEIFPKRIQKESCFGTVIFPTETDDPFWQSKERAKVGTRKNCPEVQRE